MRLVSVIHFDDVEQWRRALTAQPGVEPVAEGAEVCVFAIAEREHAVAQIGKIDGSVEHGADESSGRVGRVAFACRAYDEQRALNAG